MRRVCRYKAMAIQPHTQELGFTVKIVHQLRTFSMFSCSPVQYSNFNSAGFNSPAAERGVASRATVRGVAMGASMERQTLT